MEKKSLTSRLFSTTIIYFIANFSTRILSFFLLPLYTKYLSPSDYGNIDLILTFAQFITPLITLNVTNAAFRFLIDENEVEGRSRIIASSSSVLFIGYVILSIFSVVGYVITHNIFIILGGIYIILSTFNSYVLQCYRGIKKNKTYAIMGVVNSALHIFLNIVFIVGLNLHSYALILSPIISSAIVCIILVFNNSFYKYFNKNYFTKDELKQMMKFALPTVPETLIWWFLTGFSKTHLSSVHGTDVLGIYAVATKFADLLIALYSVFNMAWAEFAYAAYKEKNRDNIYSVAYNSIARVMLSVVMILIPLTNLSISWLLDESYQVGKVYMPVLYIMAFINILSSYYGIGFQSAKNTKSILYSSLIAVAINVPLCILLIPEYVIWGTIIALFAANISLLITKKQMSKKFFTVKLDYKWLFLLLPVTISTVAFYWGNSEINFVCLFCSIIIAFISNWSLITTICYSIVKRKK